MEKNCILDQSLTQSITHSLVNGVGPMYDLCQSLSICDQTDINEAEMPINQSINQSRKMHINKAPHFQVIRLRGTGDGNSNSTLTLTP